METLAARGTGAAAVWSRLAAEYCSVFTSKAEMFEDVVVTVKRALDSIRLTAASKVGADPRLAGKRVPAVLMAKQDQKAG